MFYFFFILKRCSIFRMYIFLFIVYFKQFIFYIHDAVIFNNQDMNQDQTIMLDQISYMIQLH